MNILRITIVLAIVAVCGTNAEAKSWRLGLYAGNQNGVSFTNRTKKTHTYSIRASGAWTISAGNWDNVGPLGHGFVANNAYRLPGVNVGCLIMRTPDGRYRWVGTGFSNQFGSVRVRLKPGEKVVFVCNDYVGSYGDNRGQMEIILSR